MVENVFALEYQFEGTRKELLRCEAILGSIRKTGNTMRVFDIKEVEKLVHLCADIAIEFGGLYGMSVKEKRDE